MAQPGQGPDILIQNLRQTIGQMQNIQQQFNQITQTVNNINSMNVTINMNQANNEVEKAKTLMDKLRESAEAIKQNKIKVAADLSSLWGMIKTVTHLDGRITALKGKLSHLARPIMTRITPILHSPIVSSIKAKLSSIKATIVADTTLFFKGVKRVFTFARNLFGAPFHVAVMVRDLASTGLKKIGSVAGGIAGVIGKVAGVAKLAASGLGAVAGGIGSALSSGMEKEKQLMLIRNKAGSGNAAGTEQYIQSLQNSAKMSPFAEKDMLSVGASAIQATGGDSKQAMEMVNLAQNMAAVNPDKSLADAMQALINAKNDKGEGLKEFGFSANQSTAGGDLSKLKNDKGMNLTQAFAGGKEQLAQTASGMVSSMTNSLTASFTDLGLKAILALKPALEMVMPMVQSLTPLFEQLGNAVANGIGKMVTFLQNNKGTIDSFKNTFLNLFSQVGAGLGQFMNWLMPLIPPIIANISQSVQKAVEFIQPLLPPIMTLFQSVFGWIVENMPTFQSAIGAVFDTLGPIIQSVLNVFTMLWDLWMEAWPGIQSVLETVWGVVSPVLEAAFSIIELIFKSFKKLFEFFMPVFEKIWELLKPLIDGFGKAFSLFGDGINWVKKKLFGGDDEGETGNPHAAGLRTVPRDGYPAILHKNEAVLTAQEANLYRNGARGGGITINLNNPVAREEADFRKWAVILRSELESAGLNMA